MAKANVEHAWWHPWCGVEVAGAEPPAACPRCQEPVSWADLGWRVGYNTQTYSYYSTLESAQKDKRA